MDLVVEIEDGVGCLGQSDSEPRLAGVAEGGKSRLHRRHRSGDQHAAPHSADLSGHREPPRGIPDGRQLLHDRARHPGGLPVESNLVCPAILLLGQHARCLPCRCSGFGEHVQHSSCLDDARSRDGRIRPGQVASDAEIDREPRTPPGQQLWLGKRLVPAADRLCRCAVLRTTQRRAGLDGSESALLRDLRRQRRWEDGNQICRQSLHRTGRGGRGGPRQSHQSGERHAPLDGVLAGPDQRVRFERRPAAAAERARTIIGLRFWRQPALCRRQQVAVGSRVHDRAAAPASRQHPGNGRLYAPREEGQPWRAECLRSRVKLSPCHGDRSEQWPQRDRV